MLFDREKHHRRSIRLRRFDYTHGNVFFVTICSYQKECIFGNVSNGSMVLNEQGKCIEKAWLETVDRRPSVKLDGFIIMPNHFHGIIWIIDQRRGTACRAPDACRAFEIEIPSHTIGTTPPRVADRSDRQGKCRESVLRCAHTSDPKCEQFGQPVSGSLPTIIRSFKSATSKYVNESRNSPGTPIWQRNYYEHVIRNEVELRKIREYIRCNPENWQTDEEYSPA